MIEAKGELRSPRSWQEGIFVYIDGSLEYPAKAPFNPPKNYPECRFKNRLDSSNRIYASIRNVLKLMDLDIGNYDSSRWSPFSDFIDKGNTVLVKPNLVYHMNFNGGSIFAIVTHASIIRAIIDYAYKAVGDGGKIIVADTPQNGADFEKIMEVTGLKDVVVYLKDNFSIPVELYDLRKEQLHYEGNVVVDRKPLPGDPKGYVSVDLGKESMLADFDADYKRFYGAGYDRRKTMSFHNRVNHTYVIPRTVLESDVIINTPKLKTHMKTGITISLKNMIGIIGDKNSIVHFRVGSMSKCGDEYPEWTPMRDAFLIWLNRKFSDVFLSRNIGFGLYRKMIKVVGGKSGLDSQSGRGKFLHSGNWCGNDTTWRTVTDAVRIAIYCDKHGQIHTAPQRNIFIIVDGIVGGEGQGPLGTRSKNCGTIICGASPWKVDLVSARLMGFNERKIPLISEGNADLSHDDLYVTLCMDGKKKAIEDLVGLPNLQFKAARTWDHIYLSSQGDGTNDLKLELKPIGQAC